MRKPHARLAHANWSYRDVYDEFRSAWHYLVVIRSVPWKQTEWTTAHNEINFACIVKWRLQDAFARRPVPETVAHAFEAILLADSKGETLPLAYAYAQGAVRTGLVPRSAPEEQQVGGAVAECEADDTQADHADGLGASIAETAERA